MPPPEMRANAQVFTTQEFLSALEDDPLKPLDQIRVLCEGNPNLARNFQMLELYMQGQITYEELGKQYGVTKQRAQQITEGCVDQIWEMSSQDKQRRYPREQIRIAYGPGSKGIEAYVRRSQDHDGGRGGPFARLFARLADIESPPDLTRVAEELQLTPLQIAQLRSKFKRLDINLPYLRKRTDVDHQSLLTAIQTSTDDEETQNLLDIFLETPNMRFIASQAGPDSVLVTLQEISTGFYRYLKNAEHFSEILQNAGVPCGRIETTQHGRTVHYYYILRRDIPRARGIIESAESLQVYRENPVKIVCGYDDATIPTTTELARQRDFKHVGSLIRNLTDIKSFRTPGFQISTILTECPVTVFWYNNNYYYHTNSEDVLSSYLQAKLQELGII